MFESKIKTFGSGRFASSNIYDLLEDEVDIVDNVMIIIDECELCGGNYVKYVDHECGDEIYQIVNYQSDDMEYTILSL
jgi:hypothetical protein